MTNERSVEIPWAIAYAEPPILDVGCVGSEYIAQLKWPVDGIDVRMGDEHSAVRNFYRADIRKFDPEHRYRTVLAVSTLEHVGLAFGTYGTTDDDVKHGDRRALEACCRLGDVVMFSVPFGKAGDYGWFRQYDRERLDVLCKGIAYKLEVWEQAEPDWVIAQDLDRTEELEYHVKACSARAVALVTVTP